VLSKEAIAKLSMQDLERSSLPLTGMTTDEFEADGRNWLASAKDPRWKRPYTELVYQPMLELMTYLRASGFKTYIVTGFGQDFVRLYSQQVYGIPPEQVIGSALAVKYGYGKDGKPILIPEPKVMLNDTAAGKPEGIHLMIGRRRTHRLVTQLETNRCWNIRVPETARVYRCLYCTTMQYVSTLMVQRRGCPIPRSAPSPPRSMPKQNRKTGPSSV
jgi:hypothetical protein